MLAGVKPDNELTLEIFRSVVSLSDVMDDFANESDFKEFTPGRSSDLSDEQSEKTLLPIELT